MTRRDALPGIRARAVSDCPRCHKVIRPGDRIAFRRGEAIHCACASGADDE